MKRAVLLALPLLLLSIVTGCRASVSAKASGSAATTGKDGKELKDYDKPMVAKASTEDEIGGPAEVHYALLGARQDLTYAGPPTATCACLAVAVGQPNDPRFAWEATVPVVDSNNQVVVALTSQSVACKQAKKGSLGASYQGYVTDGTNVMVLVEAAHSGRPVTSGAIIPRPGAGGALYIRPVLKDLPYGKALDGGSLRCTLPVRDGTQAPQAAGSAVRMAPAKAKAIGSGDAPEKATDDLDSLIEPEPEAEPSGD